MSASDYEVKLDLPFEYVPVYPEIDPRRLNHIAIKREDIPYEIGRFFLVNGLSINHAEYFYTPPNTNLPPHVDHHHFHDYTKLNWMFGGEGSTMDWYDVLPGFEPIVRTTQIGSKFMTVPRGYLKLAHSALIGRPSLIHYGGFHGVTNTNNPRHVFSFAIGDKHTHTAVPFNKSKEIFKKYVV